MSQHVLLRSRKEYLTIKLLPLMSHSVTVVKKRRKDPIAVARTSSSNSRDDERGTAKL